MKSTIKKTTIILTLFLLSLTLTPYVSEASNHDGISAQISKFFASKKCNYIDRGEYLPFSDINGQFPVFGKLMSGAGGCIDVTNSVNDMFAYGFQVFLGIVSLIAVVQVSIAGIQWMLQDAAPSAIGKSSAKQKLTNSIIGLVLALSSWLILNAVNPRILNVNLNLGEGGEPLAEFIQKGVDQANINPVKDAGSSGVKITNTTLGNNTSSNTTIGTRDATGAIKPNSNPTVFGYNDGDGTVGGSGDNGLGNGSWSPEPGWTYYNGGSHNPSGDANNYSQGVALPRSTLIRDFGSAANVKNGGYEIFKNGQSIGVFPVVDDSASKLDMSYGLVKKYFDPAITSSNSWDSSQHNITYKPIKDYWLTNTRPLQPMVRDSFKTTPTASEVDATLQNSNNFKYD